MPVYIPARSPNEEFQNAVFFDNIIGKPIGIKSYHNGVYVGADVRMEVTYANGTRVLFKHLGEISTMSSVSGQTSNLWLGSLLDVFGLDNESINNITSKLLGRSPVCLAWCSDGISAKLGWQEIDYTPYKIFLSINIAVTNPNGAMTN